MSGAEQAPGSPEKPAGFSIQRTLIVGLATGLGSGFSPVAPGTAGTALAVLLYLPLAHFCATRGMAGTGMYIAVTAAVAGVGVWAATHAEPIFGKKDAGQVVIDEIAGYLVTMFALPVGWMWALAGFGVFRLFDVWKPWPIHGLQKIRGGWGVMVDDLLAGLYGCVVLQAAAWVLGRM